MVRGMSFGEAGRLTWDDNVFKFEGDAHVSAEIFIEKLNRVFTNKIESLEDEIERLNNLLQEK